MPPRHRRLIGDVLVGVLVGGGLGAAICLAAEPAPSPAAGAAIALGLACFVFLVGAMDSSRRARPARKRRPLAGVSIQDALLAAVVLACAAVFAATGDVPSAAATVAVAIVLVALRLWRARRGAGRASDGGA